MLALGDGWQATLYRDWAFPQSVVDNWNRLAAEYGDAGVFLDYHWFQCWWSAFGKPGSLFVMVLEEAGAVRGIFPFRFSEDERRRPIITSLSDDYPFDVLLSAEHREQTLRYYFAARARAGSGAIVRMENVPARSESPVRMASEARRSWTPSALIRVPRAPYIDLRTHPWEDFVAGLSSRLGNTIRKCRRRAEKQGELCFEVVRQTADLDRLLTQLFEVESRSWKGAERTAINCDRATESFYRLAALQAMNAGRLYIFILKLNGEPIAFEIGFASGCTMFGLKTGFDQSTADRLSPGNLMRYEMLRFLFADPQFATYDFLGGCYAWKLEWTGTTDHWTSIDVYPSTLPGWIRYGLEHGWKQPLKASATLRSLIQRFREPSAHPSRARKFRSICP